MSVADAAHFDDLVALTQGLLARDGLATVTPGFIEYWLSRGKTPLEIRHIALGHPARCSDAHLGGTEE